MTTTTVPTVAERVQAGAEWLDQHESGWLDRIDEDLLDMGSRHRDVLGQLSGDFCHYTQDWGWTEISRLGFAIANARYNGKLTQAWRDLIAARRAGGVR